MGIDGNEELGKKVIRNVPPGHRIVAIRSKDIVFIRLLWG